MSEPILQIEGVSFSYDHALILEDVSLNVQQGEFLAIVGPNGSGKSTLIKLILGLLKPSSGKIVRYTKRMGYVSQKANRFHTGFPATVEEVVASGLYGELGLFSSLSKEERTKVERAMEQVDLVSYRDRNIGQLSGGQQQRVFIARALVADPELLILDEPTVGMDMKSTRVFYEFLHQLHRKQPISLVMVTHDLSVIAHYVDRVACLNHRLLFHGDAATFQEQQQKILSNVYGHEMQLLKPYH